jgi:hypothetical protein
MLDSDLIGDFDSSSIRVLCFSGAPLSSELLVRLHPFEDIKEDNDDDDVEGSPQLIIERFTACFKAAPFITFCFNEFCCDGDNVLSCSCNLWKENIKIRKCTLCVKNHNIPESS